MAALPDMLNGQRMPSLAPLVDRASPAVVNIAISGNFSTQTTFTPFADPDNEAQIYSQPFVGIGSGVIIDNQNGYIITNFHVIENATEIKITLKSGLEFTAQVIGHDKHSDLALLQIKTDKALTQIEFANSDDIRVGDFVLAIGNPFGLGQTVTSGIISALGRSGLNLGNLENFIQTDAAINEGNSGGALIDLKGQLVGINSAIFGSDNGNIGIGFAIPANMVKNIAQQLRQYGQVRRGILGIKGQELTPELADAFALDSPHGAFIKQVTPYSAAEKAGLKAGDVIISIGGSTIKTFAELRAKIGSLRAGTRVELGVIQNGKAVILVATLQLSQLNKTKAHLLHPFLAGAILADADENTGVKVTSVAKDSLAQHYGLQQGDLIIGINRRRINNLSELAQMIKTAPEILVLNIQRDKRGLYLILN